MWLLSCWPNACGFYQPSLPCPEAIGRCQMGLIISPLYMEKVSLPQTPSLDPRSPRQLEAELSCSCWVEMLKLRYIPLSVPALPWDGLGPGLSFVLNRARCVGQKHHGRFPAGLLGHLRVLMSEICFRIFCGVGKRVQV